MAAPYVIEATLTNGGANMSYGSYDGTYIWFTTRTSGTTSQRLYRFRVSDQALVKPDGTVGTEADAYVDLEKTGYYGCVVSDGTYVTLNEHNAASSIERFSAVDMSRLGTVAIGNTSSTEMGFAYGGKHYHPGWNSTVGRACIWEITPSTGAATRVYTSADPATSTGVYLMRQGTYAYLTDTANNGFGIEKIDMTTWTRVWLSASPGAPRIGVGAYDAVREEWWFCSNNAEVVRVRDSDGAYLTRAAAADTYANSIIASAPDGAITFGIGCVVNDAEVYIGGTNTEKFFNRRSTSPTVNPLTGYAAAQLGRSALYASNVTPQFVIGPKLFMLMQGRASSGFGQTGIAWTQLEGTTPNLTAVDPGAGPHLSLTFDAEVGITGPTIGAASDGLGVTGVTAISTTQIDLACAIRPDHPDGDASSSTLVPPIGEADNLGPPIPTGVGATVL